MFVSDQEKYYYYACAAQSLDTIHVLRVLQVQRKSEVWKIVKLYFIIAVLVVFVYLWCTDMETVKLYHVSRFGNGPKILHNNFCQYSTIEIYLVGGATTRIKF